MLRQRWVALPPAFSHSSKNVEGKKNTGSHQIALLSCNSCWEKVRRPVGEGYVPRCAVCFDMLK